MIFCTLSRQQAPPHFYPGTYKCVVVKCSPSTLAFSGRAKLGRFARGLQGPLDGGCAQCDGARRHLGCSRGKELQRKILTGAILLSKVEAGEFGRAGVWFVGAGTVRQPLWRHDMAIASKIIAELEIITESRFGLPAFPSK